MSTSARLLLAEDEETLGALVYEYLSGQGFELIWAKNGQEALEMYLSQKPELLILDIMMPRMDGLEVARKVRMDNAEVPVIFLTAKSQSKDVVEGFKAGANDYLKKPLSMEELKVCIEALLGRLRRDFKAEVLTIGQWSFNHVKQELHWEDRSVSLTHREAELLYYLLQNKNELLDRSFILKKLWGDDDFFSARSMDVFISKLRKKLKADPDIQIINVRGHGYKLLC